MVTLLPSVESGGVSLSQSFDADGTGCYTQPTPGLANGECVTLSTDNSELLPSIIKLYQNYTNPFNPSTNITSELNSDAYVEMKVYDMNGGFVKNLVSRNETAGYHSIDWDGTNYKGQRVSAGIYVYRLQSANILQTKKMILLK